MCPAACFNGQTCVTPAVTHQRQPIAHLMQWVATFDGTVITYVHKFFSGPDETPVTFGVFWPYKC